ncbi:MAG: urea transporter [Rhizobacter sp.]
MKVFGTTWLPELEPAQVPLWRQVMRGFSQCAFQAHELTGLFFIAAVALYNPRMALFYVLSVLLGTLTTRVLKGDPVLLGLGLFGFNSGLMGLALGNFFAPAPAMYAWVPLLAVVVGAVTVAMARWLPFPFLAAPFILTFWVVWPLAGAMGMQAIDLGAFPDAPVLLPAATITALGSTLFAATVVSGVLFLAGVLVSSWRHALVALFGALLAAALAAHVGAKGAMINSGFIGYNAVLAALAAYVVVAADLRLAALAALVSTWIFSFIGRHAPVPALASGFVLTVWVILLMGWLNPRFQEHRTASSA